MKAGLGFEHGDNEGSEQHLAAPCCPTMSHCLHPFSLPPAHLYTNFVGTENPLGMVRKVATGDHCILELFKRLGPFNGEVSTYKDD